MKKSELIQSALENLHLQIHSIESDDSTSKVKICHRLLALKTHFKIPLDSFERDYIRDALCLPSHSAIYITSLRKSLVEALILHDTGTKDNSLDICLAEIARLSSNVVEDDGLIEGHYFRDNAIGITLDYYSSIYWELV